MNSIFWYRQCRTWRKHTVKRPCCVTAMCSTRRSYTKYLFGSTRPVRSGFSHQRWRRAAASSVQRRCSRSRSTCIRSFSDVHTTRQCRQPETEDHLLTTWFAVITSRPCIVTTCRPASTASVCLVIFCQVRAAVSIRYSAVLFYVDCESRLQTPSDVKHRVPTHSLKYLNFFLLNSRPWKYLKRGQVLESP